MENNKSYCRMPFVGFQSTHKDTRLCCATKASTPMMSKDFWNSDYIKDVRSKMLKGEMVADCQKCYDDEAAGKVSERNHYNSRFKEFKQYDTPTVLDLDLSNLCNLQCVMCGPGRSSQWAKELGDKKVLTVTKEKLEDICAISHNLRYLQIQGGEPSIMPEFEYFFTFLTEKDLAKNIEIDCISNLTNVNNKFYSLLENFKRVNLNASIDSYGSANDYIRYPSNFEKIENNLKSLAHKNLRINLQITLQVLSMFNFYDFLNWVSDMQNYFEKYQKDLGLNLSYVVNHRHLDVRNAPTDLKQRMLGDIKKFTHKQKIKNNVKFNVELKNLEHNILVNDGDTYTKQLAEYVNQLDQRRNIQITNFIPDFKKYF